MAFVSSHDVRRETRSLVGEWIDFAEKQYVGIQLRFERCVDGVPIGSIGRTGDVQNLVGVEMCKAVFERVRQFCLEYLGIPGLVRAKEISHIRADFQCPGADNEE